MIYLFASSKSHDVEYLPLIDFKRLQDSIDFEDREVLLFTSKNSVKILDTISSDWKNLGSIAIGEESAKAIKELGGTVIFSSNGYSKELLQDIKKKFKDKKILYLRPKVVATNYIQSLKGVLDIRECILYETECKEYDSAKKPPPNATLIFTSPSTITCFIKNFGSLSGYKIVAIGATTAKALPKEIEFVVPSKPTIKECIKIAFAFEK